MRTCPPENAPVTSIQGAGAFEDAADMVFALDRHGRIAFVNRAAESVTGMSRDDLLGRPFTELVSGPHPGSRGETALRRSDGSLAWVEVTTWSSSGHVWGIARDVTERRRELEVLRHKAFHDPLTQLPNRALFEDRVLQGLKTSSRTGRPLALMLLDLDGFKDVNDRHGHQCGDEVLRLVAARMVGALRTSDTVARLGGDEFAILLPEGDAEEAAHVAMKLRRAIREPVVLGDVVCNVDASIGVAAYPVDGQDMKALFASADSAMYTVKRAGGGSVVVSRHGRSVTVPVVARRSRRRAVAAVAAALVLAVAWVPGGSSPRPGSTIGPVAVAPTGRAGSIAALPGVGPSPGVDVSGLRAAFSGGGSWWQHVSAGLALSEAESPPDLSLSGSQGAPPMAEVPSVQDPGEPAAPEPVGGSPAKGQGDAPSTSRAPSYSRPAASHSSAKAPSRSGSSPGRNSPRSCCSRSSTQPSSPSGKGQAKPAAQEGSSGGAHASPSKGRGR